jgi:TRAP-type C4-dicarboxylate transport system permease small subunit
MRQGMENALAHVLRTYRLLLELCGIVAGLLIGALAIMVALDVLVRNTGAGSLPWVLEVGEYILYISTFLAAPWVLGQNAHVRVDVFVNLLRPAAVRVVEGAVNGVGLAISLVMLFFGFTAALDAYRIGSLIFKELIVPEWWLLSVIPFSAALLATEFCLRFARARAPAPEREAITRDGL